MGSKTNPTPTTPDPITSAWGSIGAHVSWAKTTDRSKRTAPGRAAFEQKFLDEADGDPVRAEHLRKAHFRRLAIKSAQARRKRTATTVAAELETLGGSHDDAA